MMTTTLKLAFTGTLLGSCTAARAHPGHHNAVSVYHYLTNPDHAVIFVLLGLSAASAFIYVIRRNRGAAKQRRD